MYKILTVLAVAALVAGPAAASDKTDVMAVVHQWIDGYNRGGDMKSALAACADQTTVMDDIPPYEWHGAGACAKWFSDFEAFAKANEFTDGFLTIGKPRHLYVTADRAYVVVPAGFTYKIKGKPMKQSGSIATLTLQKGDSGWRLTGAIWSAGTDAGVKAAAGS
jgi:hypothetical protein